MVSCAPNRASYSPAQNPVFVRTRSNYDTLTWRRFAGGRILEGCSATRMWEWLGDLLRSCPRFEQPTCRVRPSEERRLSRRSRRSAGVAHLSRKPIMTGHAVVRGPASPTVRIMSLLMLAAVVVRGVSASAEAEQKRMTIATKNCRSVASTFHDQRHEYSMLFLGSREIKHFHEKCSTLGAPGRRFVRSCMNPRWGSLKRLAYLLNFAPGSKPQPRIKAG